MIKSFFLFHHSNKNNFLIFLELLTQKESGQKPWAMVPCKAYFFRHVFILTFDTPNWIT